MIDLTPEIHSLSEFKQNTSDHLDRLKTSGMPEVLTVDGKAELVVQDAASYQRILDRIDELDALQQVRSALERVRNGDRGLPPKESFQGTLDKFGVKEDS